MINVNVLPFTTTAIYKSKRSALLLKQDHRPLYFINFYKCYGSENHIVHEA